MHRVACLVLALAAITFARPAMAGPVLVFDASSGTVIHSEDAGAPWFPASLTKLMTVYLAFKAVDAGQLAMDSRLTVSAAAAAQAPSKLGLPVGATIDLETALQSVIIKSANDIAVVVAEGVAGSLERFVALMNDAARDLGMNATRFTNPNGLPDHDQVTTARDLGLLAGAILNGFPQHAHLFALQQFTLGKRAIHTHNRLLKDFAGADGMKTGFICASGYNLVASATRNGRTLVAVVLGSPSGSARNQTAAQLLERGFDRAWWKSIVPRKLSDLEYEAAMQPVHMGPVVCKRRYQGSSDAFAVDARLAARQEAQEAKQAKQATITDLNLDVPLPPARPDLAAPIAAGAGSVPVKAAKPVKPVKPAKAKTATTAPAKAKARTKQR